MRMLSASSNASTLPRLAGVAGCLRLVGVDFGVEVDGVKAGGCGRLRSIGYEFGDDMIGVVTRVGKVGVTSEVVVVIELTAEIGETSGCAMNT